MAKYNPCSDTESESGNDLRRLDNKLSTFRFFTTIRFFFFLGITILYQ